MGDFANRIEYLEIVPLVVPPDFGDLSSARQTPMEQQDQELEDFMLVVVQMLLLDQMS